MRKTGHSMMLFRESGHWRLVTMESCCSQKLNLNSGPSTLQLPKDAMRLSKLSLRVKILECFRLLVEVRKALDLRQDKVLNSLSIKKMQSFRRLSSSKDYSPKCSMKKSKLSHKVDKEHQLILTEALLKNNTNNNPKQQSKVMN